MKRITRLPTIWFFWATILPTILWSAQAQADYLQRPEVQAFIDEMVTSEAIDRAWLEQLFTEATYSQSVIDAITRPAEKTLTWGEYQKIFLTDIRRQRGIEFWTENAQTLVEAEVEFGVPAEIILAILGVETSYGRNTGGYRVIDSLSTLAFDYPPRATFFRGELRSLVLLANQHHIDPSKLTGSYAGAMGYAQFIPSSYIAFSSDYDGDGFADLWTSPADAIWSIGNYLSGHGWQRGQPIFQSVSAPDAIAPDFLNRDLKPYVEIDQLRSLGVSGLADASYLGAVTLMQLEGLEGSEYWVGYPNFYVITRYNHSPLYAMAVAQLAAQLRNGMAGKL